VSDWDERMKGGAVREERSPLKEAMDCEKRQYTCRSDKSRVVGRLLLVYLEESSPAAAVGDRGGLSFGRHVVLL
jgi:hypothetical protein